MNPIQYNAYITLRIKHLESLRPLKPHWQEELKCKSCKKIIHNCSYCGRAKLNEKDHIPCFVLFIRLAKNRHDYSSDKTLPRLRKADILYLDRRKRGSTKPHPKLIHQHESEFGKDVINRRVNYNLKFSNAHKCT
jgi:hypothetical protein